MNLSKRNALVLLFILFVSGLFLDVFSVASATKPVTPEFTIRDISQPYDIPPTTITSVDPYTGEKHQ